MKIGIDIRAAVHEPAGIGTLTLNLVKHLAQIDRVNEYFLYGDTKFDFGISNSNVCSVTKSFGNTSAGKLLWHMYVTLDARYGRRLDRFISVGSLQISALTNEFAVAIIPDLSHILLPEFHVAKSRLTSRFLMRRALINARRVVAISEHTKADILAYMKGEITETKVSVAHIACEDYYSQKPTEEDRLRVREKYGLCQQYILSVGTLEPRKNHAMLIKAFSEIVREGDAHELVIAGRKGWFFGTIFEEARKSGLESRIRFLDFVPLIDMPALYAMADVFVYPSLYEGFGIPPLEAMTCGVPVITSNVTSLPEVTGDAAILIDPSDVNGLVVQLRLLLGNPELRQSLAQAGRERARRFSWKSFAENVLLALHH